MKGTTYLNIVAERYTHSCQQCSLMAVTLFSRIVRPTVLEEMFRNCLRSIAFTFKFPSSQSSIYDAPVQTSLIHGGFITPHKANVKTNNTTLFKSSCGVHASVD